MNVGAVVSQTLHARDGEIQPAGQFRADAPVAGPAELADLFAPVPQALLLDASLGLGIAVWWGVVNRYTRGRNRTSDGWAALAAYSGRDPQWLAHWAKQTQRAGWATLEPRPGRASLLVLHTEHGVRPPDPHPPANPQGSEQHPSGNRQGPPAPPAPSVPAGVPAGSTPRAESSCTAPGTAPTPSRTPAPHAPLRLDPGLAPLRAALRSSGLAPRWDRLRPHQAAELLELVRDLGTAEMAALAANTTRAAVRDGAGPALHVQAYLDLWRRNAAVFPHERPTPRPPRDPAPPAVGVPAPTGGGDGWRESARLARSRIAARPEGRPVSGLDERGHPPRAQVPAARRPVGVPGIGQPAGDRGRDRPCHDGEPAQPGDPLGPHRHAVA